MIEISIVVPVYNSEDNLTELCFQVEDALKDISYELILVNDSSTDNSWKVIEQLSVKYAQVNGVNLRKNCGQDNALMAGLNLSKGNYAVIMDDDLQHSPYDIVKLYEACKNSSSDVCYANFEKREQALWKNFGSWFNGKISEWMMNKPKHIYLSPYKIFTREIVDEIIKYVGPYPYVDGLILWVTDNIIQIDVEHHKRFKGSSNFNFTRSISVFLKNVTTFSVTPLRVASIVGSICSVIGFVMIVYYLIDYFVHKNVVEGWTTLAVLQLFMGGLLLLSLGLKGEYLGRTYMNVNNKPQFTIKNTTKS